MTGRVGRVALATLAVLLVVALDAAAAAISPGRRPAAESATPRVALLEQPAWSSLGTDVPLRLAFSGPLTGLEVRAIVHSTMTSRTAFERTVDGERLGSTIATTAALPEVLPADPSGGRIFPLRLQDPNQPRDPNRLRLPLPRGQMTGVFPVEIELRDPESGERASSFVTHLVASAPSTDGASLGEPLNVSWVWPVEADPATTATGRIRRSFLDAIGPAGRLTRLATASARTGDVPLTLVPGPETLESWAERARTDAAANTGVLALRAAARIQQVISGPYVRIDMPALERVGLGEDVATELSEGSDVLGRALGTRVDPRTATVSPLDPVAVARLQNARVDRLLVSPDELVPPDEPPQLTPAQPFELESGGRKLAAFQTDDGLADLLGGRGTPALRAAHFLAGLVVVAIELPNQTRGLAIEMPPRWDPSSALINAALAGLGQLHDAGLVNPVTLDGLFDAVPLEETRSGPVVRQLAEPPAEPPTVNPAKYRATRDRLRAFASTVPAGDPRIAGGERGLLISLTSVWPGAEGRARSGARLDAIDAGIVAFSGLIETPPNGLTVTFTSRDAELPLSFNNKTGERLRVRIRFESDKLVFADGAEQFLTLPPNNKTFRFPVETRASGTFPLRMTLTTEDGRLPIGSARYTVRSTVVSGVGIFLTIGAGLFLAIWWITHWRRSRRQPIRPATLAT